MTEQYGQRNINNPEGARTEANTAADTDFTLTAADTGKMVILDTTEAPGTATLPRAAEAGAGAEICIVAPEGVAGALEIAIITALPADILEQPSVPIPNPLITDNSSIIVRSDGNLTWYVVGGEV